MSTVLVTGAAGFIGAAVAQKLLSAGIPVVGVDNFNSYYDVTLKESRASLLAQSSLFCMLRGDLSHSSFVQQAFAKFRPSHVIHLAAQAGVRYSFENPQAYIDSNITGFLNILEGCRAFPVKHLVYASSSSVYGAHADTPFSEHSSTDHPVSLYAATKKANEMMAHSYSSNFSIPTTGLRFFTVYGPWGRPDMAVMKFTKSILAGESIEINNFGNLKRDFTYIDDIVQGIERIFPNPSQADLQWSAHKPDSATSQVSYRIYNIGNNSSVELLQFVQTLEKVIGKKAKMNLVKMAAGDVLETCANVDDLRRDFGFAPRTDLEEGLNRFYSWYRDYYKSKTQVPLFAVELGFGRSKSV